MKRMMPDNNFIHCERCKRDEIQLLYAVSEALSKSINLQDVLGPVLKSMAECMGMLRGTVTILNRETGEISIEEAFGLSKIQQSRGKYKIGEGITGKVVQTGKTLIVPKISQEPDFRNKTRSREIPDKSEISFICVPIILNGKSIGTLSADRLYDENVSLDEDVRLLEIIASMVANAVHLRQHTEEKILRLNEENKRLNDELKDKFKPDNILGNSKPMKMVYALISKVLQSNTTVLIRGESGVGKELVANAIHYNSFRSQYPFIKVNCAALPENLIESELFGHERGAFTGAVTQRKGKFEAANGGTLFLDEIGDLPLSTQTKLLRVIQEREFERLGSNHPIKVNVRIIAATNRSLEEMVESGDFREDLYYRVNVYPIHVPPLRERKSDILLLTNHFIEKYSSQNDTEIRMITSAAMDIILSYQWTGNVRELENTIERAVLLSTDGVIHSYHLPPTMQNAGYINNAKPESLNAAIELLEQEMINDALKTTKGNLTKAAEILDITERIIGLRVRKYNIDLDAFKD